MDQSTYRSPSLDQHQYLKYPPPPPPPPPQQQSPLQQPQPGLGDYSDPRHAPVTAAYPPPQKFDAHDGRLRSYPQNHAEGHQPEPARYVPPPPPPPPQSQQPNDTPLPPYPLDSNPPRVPHAQRPDVMSPGALPYVPFSPPPQPLNDAVSSAFNRVDTSSYPPDLVAQIAEDVIKRLQSVNVGTASSSQTQPMTQSQAPPPPPPAMASSLSNSQSESVSPTIPKRDVYTPPSPNYGRGSFSASGHSPPPQPVGVGSMSNPPPPDGAPRSPVYSRVSEGSQSPRSPHKARFGERGPPSPDGEATNRPQPARQPTDKEETPLDRTWGKLFDEQGRSTARLGQFLRGLANHIIEDLEPVNSIVITPPKMMKFYELCRLQSETWPWARIFKELSLSKLSKVYQELQCQHHLVQAQRDDIPTIPGLTPVGFERWMTLLMLARPDEEVERLQKAVLEMPISNADDPKERFPKDISRRLFPQSEDRRARDMVEKAFAVEARSTGARATNRESLSNSVSSLANQLERERQPYSGTPSEAATEDLPLPGPPRTKLERERMPYVGSSESAIDDSPQPVFNNNNIERERKPYVAQPGGGRTIDPDLKPSPAVSTGRVYPVPRPRTQSASGRPADLPFQEPHRPARASSIINPPPRGRRRSPSISQAGGPFRRSDNDMLGYPDHSVPIDIGGPEDPRRFPARRPGGESPSRHYESPRDSERSDRMADGHGPKRGYEDEYYRHDRHGSRGAAGGYDFNPPYPPPPSNYR